MQRHRAWLVVAPLALAGSELAHASVNRLVGTPPGELLERGGPGTGLVPALAFAAAACVLLGLAWRVLAPAEPARGATLLPFACAAPAVFVLQEQLETLLSGGSPLATPLEPTFLPGLALQLPFALASYLLARLLLRVADDVRGLVGRRRPARRHATPPRFRAPATAVVPRPARRRSPRAPRAPPAAAAHAAR